MATYDSKYYYDKYKDKKAAVKTYEKNIGKLQDIKNALTDTMYDEIRNVNNELDALVEDLKKGVRHNSTFTNRANDFSSQKEKAVTADNKLSTTVSELEEEINSLTTKKNRAVTDRDTYKRKCKEKLEEEGKPSWYYWF